MKTLVVYFSRTGHTRQVAQAIADRLGADIECVADLGNRSGVWGYIRSLREAMQQRVINIGAAGKNPSDYDLIILGTPVWAHNMCSPLRSYIMAQKQKFRAVAVLCTQGGSGAGKVVGDVARLCGRTPAGALVLDEREIKQGQAAAKLDAFIKSVTLAPAASAGMNRRERETRANAPS
jgi:flavodoxin